MKHLYIIVTAINICIALIQMIDYAKHGRMKSSNLALLFCAWAGWTLSMAVA